jgi:hypothetical protein
MIVALDRPGACLHVVVAAGHEAPLTLSEADLGRRGPDAGAVRVVDLERGTIRTPDSQSAGTVDVRGVAVVVVEASRVQSA